MSLSQQPTSSSMTPEEFAALNFNPNIPRKISYYDPETIRKKPDFDYATRAKVILSLTDTSKPHSASKVNLVRN